MPLTPSPRTRAGSMASNHSSPFTPDRHSTEIGKEGNTKSVYGGNLSSYFAKSSVSKSSKNYRESPKSNIARTRKSPRHLELGVSEWSLTGTGPSSSQSPSKERSRKEVSTRTRSNKTTVRVPHNTGDRFIPNRTASEGLLTAGTAKPEENQRPKTSGSGNEGSSVLASAASAFDIGGRGSSDDELTAALDNLGLEDNESSTSYTRPAPDKVAYESSLADACGVNLNTRILAFKPPPPESSKPIDLRAQYNRPLKPSKPQSAQFRRRIQTAPERVLDAPGLLDDYYLNLLDWSSGNQVAIGLERNVYVWSADSGTVN